MEAMNFIVPQTLIAAHHKCLRLSGLIDYFQLALRLSSRQSLLLLTAHSLALTIYRRTSAPSPAQAVLHIHRIPEHVYR